MRYEVTVSNIGTVSSGSSAGVAEKHFASYVEDSKRPHGRASGESVTLLADGEIAKEYNPPDARDDEIA